MDTSSLLTLLAAALAAGWVDAVVGGGGLLLLPALLLTPGMPLLTALGTNKLTAITGTTTAAVTFTRRTTVDWHVAGPAAGLAVLASGAGAYFVATVPAGAYRPVLLGVLVAVALFIALRPRLGILPEPGKRTPARMAAAVAICGGALAVYDGMIGPGTGTFLILTCTGLIGTDFVQSSAIAKVVNVGTNLGALVVFGYGGHVWWQLGALLAVANITGAALGARMALRHGAGFVRVVLLVVVLALIARLAWLQYGA